MGDTATSIQNIEYLRRLYAKATDLIGTAEPANVASGRAIYHRIFTEDADISTLSGGKVGLQATGPDGWLDVVLDALQDYVATQHLIGTQLVELQGNEAHMESYLHAWHERPDGTTYIFLGTYVDEVRRTQNGWQIYKMTLVQTSAGDVQIR